MSEDDVTARGSTEAEVRLPSHDLHADLSFFGETLGFRLESIFPADDPAVAVMSGHGLRIRLDRGAHEAPGAIRLLCDRPESFASGRDEIEAPNGTRIEIRAREPELARPPTRHELIVRRMDEGESWVVGRAGMQYRDLIPGRLGGAVIASHIRIPHGGPVPDMVHYHTIAFQLIYCLRGWFDLVYEDQGPPFRLEAGDCVIQPPRIRHRVLESSDNGEVIELGVPAEHPTTIDHALALPTGAFDPRREFGGQRFCRHRRRDAAWGAWRLPGFEAHRTGVDDATGGVANVEVARAANEAVSKTADKAADKAADKTVDKAVDGAAGAITSHDADILFTFLLRGGMTLRASGLQARDLRAGDAFTVPPRTPTAYERCSADLELLEVSLPGRFETTMHDGV